LDCNNEYYINFLPFNIESIEFGYNFDLKLDNLPTSIKKISFNIDSEYDKELNCLPNNLEILFLPKHYKHKINIFTKKIK